MSFACGGEVRTYVFRPRSWDVLSDGVQHAVPINAAGQALGANHDRAQQVRQCRGCFADRCETVLRYPIQRTAQPPELDGRGVGAVRASEKPDGPQQVAVVVVLTGGPLQVGGVHAIRRRGQQQSPGGFDVALRVAVEEPRD